MGSDPRGMETLAFLNDHVTGVRLPEAADPSLVRLGAERWEETVAGLDAETAEACREFRDGDPGRRLFAAIFGNSPYLAQCCLTEPCFVAQLLRQGPDATFPELLRPLNDQSGGAATAEDKSALMRRMRVTKRRAALAIAIADITAAWPLERVTGALSDTAEATLGASVRHLLGAAHRAGTLDLPFPDDPERGS